jgi:hypothetical protein
MPAKNDVIRASLGGLLLLWADQSAVAQDFKSASKIVFENPAIRTTSGGRERSFSAPARPERLFQTLSKAKRTDLFSPLFFHAVMEAEVTIGQTEYRLFFPRLSKRKAAYVFAAAETAFPTRKTFFEISPDQYTEFSERFGYYLDPLLKE